MDERASARAGVEGGERRGDDPRRGRSGGASSGAGARRDGRRRRAWLAAGWALVFAASGCAPSATATAGGARSASAPGAAPGGEAFAPDGDAAGSGGAAPTKRVAPREAPGELEQFADPERRQKLVALAERQRGELEAELRALGAPGFAWGLIVDDALVLSGAEGRTRADGGAPVTTATLFRVGSITKVFTALALLTLRERGQLSLDEPIRRWIPEFDGVVYPSADAPLITPRHVLLHRSGLPRLGNFSYIDPDRPATERDVLGALDGVALDAAPGLVHVYSNFGYGLLGQLVSRVAREPFHEYISERVLAPLGMSHSVWSPEQAAPESLARPHELRQDRLEVLREWPFGASSGAGGIYSSVDDLARFVAFQLGAWPASSRPESPVLSRAALRESQSFQSLEQLAVRQAEGAAPRGHARGQGLGWAVYRDCRFDLVAWHNGGTEGHMAAVYLLPHEGVGVVVLANRSDLDVDSPARRVLERLHDGGVLPRRERRLELAPLWTEKVEAALALGADFDVARYEALFAASFRQAVPLADMQTVLQHAAAASGRCTIGAPLPSHHPRWVAATLDCERGQRVVEAQLSADATLAGFWIGTDERHRERLARRVDPRGTCG